jgi:hypothetical protein
MILVSVVTALIHLFVIARSVVFFRTAGTVRESDKTAVASICMLSVLFLLATSLAWMEHPPLGQGQLLSGPMFFAYNLAVAIVFLGQIQMVTSRRASHACQQH